MISQSFSPSPIAKPILLSGREPAKHLEEITRQFVQKQGLTGSYVGILFLGDNPASATYVSMKGAFASKVGLATKVFGQLDSPLHDVQAVYDCIDMLNADDLCVGILIQLPVPDLFMSALPSFLSRVAPHKDIDGLGGIAFGKASIGLFDFLPATPAAVMGLLDRYDLGAVRGKTVTILGQSNLIGKPLAYALMGREATVYSYNAYSNPDVVKKTCQQSDIIISCTGVVHLITSSYVRTDKSQIIIDVGWGKKDGKAVGDVALDQIAPLVGAYTPLPGGVGPMTVANLFHNVKVLRELHNVAKLV